MLRFAVIGAVALGLAGCGGDPEYVTSATVPGMGRIDGELPRTTTLRPPAVRQETFEEGDAAADLAWRTAKGGDDSGTEAEREAVKRALARGLFLGEVVNACWAHRRAGLVVYGHVYTAPARDPSLANLARQPRLGCHRARLRVDEWKGVQVDGDDATAVLRGGGEQLVDGEWERSHSEWQAVLRRVGGEWKIAAITGDDLDYDD